MKTINLLLLGLLFGVLLTGSNPDLPCRLLVQLLTLAIARPQGPKPRQSKLQNHEL